jgi:hypothetical protein
MCGRCQRPVFLSLRHARFDRADHGAFGAPACVAEAHLFEHRRIAATL